MAEQEQQDPSKLKLDNVRLSFPDIWEARSVKNSEPKFSAHFLLDKEGHEDLLKLVEKRMKQVAAAHWGVPQAKKIWESKKFETCLHDGDEKSEMAGYGDEVMYVTSSSTRRPLVIDRDRSPLTKADARPYAGCYVNAIVRLWVQDNEFGQRVNAELMGVQFFKDGEPFGGAVPATPDDFEDFGDGDKKKKGKGKAAGDPYEKEEAGAAAGGDEEPF